MEVNLMLHDMEKLSFLGINRGQNLILSMLIYFKKVLHPQRDLVTSLTCRWKTDLKFFETEMLSTSKLFLKIRKVLCKHSLLYRKSTFKHLNHLQRPIAYAKYALAGKCCNASRRAQ